MKFEDNKALHLIIVFVGSHRDVVGSNLGTPYLFLLPLGLSAGILLSI